MDGMSAPDLATLRGQVVDIILGTVFLSIGATACAIAAIRRRGGVRILVWLGIWSALYGLQTLDRPLTDLSVLPHTLKSAGPYLSTAVMYLLLVSALLAWRELSVGKLKLIIQLEILAGLVIAIAGMATFALGGPRDQWMFYNNLLAVVALFILVLVTFVPRFSSSLVISNHRILAAGTLIFALEALYTNLMGVLHLPILPLVDSLGFAALLFALGYVALEIVFTNERRLLSVETELETARQIQSSILPAGVPELENLRIAASYFPMSTIAGDFYHFVQTDKNHVGIFVADVSGHGIPAALISSMIKVAIQSVAIHADDPAEVLSGLNRILAVEFQSQLTSAAYLWIDATNRRARYSAAGHPPLLVWRDARAELPRIESNGLLFGVAQDSEYPVCDLRVEPHDRILLYTDGLVEPENASGESFGDRRLEQVVRDNRSQPAPKLLSQLLTELRNWQPPSTSQQDDITLIVVDVL
jgi:sigma-B regulation protein RsbU (phosphoserine phosphatase)